MSRENIQDDPPRDNDAELSEHSWPVSLTVAEQLDLMKLKDEMTLVAAISAAFDDSLP